MDQERKPDEGDVARTTETRCIDCGELAQGWLRCVLCSMERNT